MADDDFSVADFFRLASEAAAHESALRIKEAEARADIRVKLAEAGIQDGGAAAPADGG